MTTTEPVADAPVRPASPIRRAWSAPLWAHVLLLLVIAVGVALATSPDGSFVADDGSYQLQLRALDQGSWTYRSPTEQLDPDGTHFPVTKSDSTADGFAPSAKHPAWPWLANAVSPLTGVGRAYAALGILGVLGMATAAWLLVAEHDRSLSRWAFWLAGTAPVAITAAVPWAHAAGTAAAGFAVLGAVRLVSGRRWYASVPFLVLGVAAASLLRTEGLLLSVAVAGALVVGGRQAGRSWGWSLGAGGAVALLAGLVVKAESAWIRQITGSAGTNLQPRSEPSTATGGFVHGRVEGAIRSTFDSARPSMTLLLAIAVVAAAVLAWLLSRGRTELVGRWQLAAGLSVAILGLRVAWLSNYPVTGILATWPVIVAGLAAAVPVAWKRVRMEVVVAVLYAGAVLATQYADGGSGSWGARFFALGTVPLAVIGAVGLARLIDAQPSRAEAGEGAERGVDVRRFLVGLLVVPALIGVAVLHDVRAGNAALYRWVDQQVEGVAVTPAAELPRMMWHHDGVDWLVVSDSDGGDDLGGLLGSLADHGPDTVSVVALTGDLGGVDRAMDGQDAWHEVRRTERGELVVLVLER